MSCCALGRSPTPLERYAETLPPSDHVDCEAAPMLFPMYTMPCELVLEMTMIEPHEVHKAKGEVVIFEDSMGKAVFVSHQWASQQHPDPECKQLTVLQDALRRLLHDVGIVPLDWVTEVYVPTARHLPVQVFRSQPLFIWYDYVSCPQLEPREGFIGGSGAADEGSDLAQAITSIPAYIGQCSFFFALCPVLTSQDGTGLLTQASWGRRGWCRMERVIRELSRDDTWVKIKSARSLEVVGSVLAFVNGSVGEGEFSKEEDRKKLAPILRQAVVRKLMFCLSSKDFAAYRRHLNLQAFYFRGLNMEPVADIIPDFECNKGSTDVVAKFLYQNGFAAVRDIDRAGWSPLHYAALNGDANIIDGLLQQGANPNKRTAREQPKLGCPPWTSPLDLALLFQHNDAARRLIAARANFQGGFTTPLNMASVSDNAEGIRLLCSAGIDPLMEDVLEASALRGVATYGSLAALAELSLHTSQEPLVVSRALFFAMVGGGGSAEMVQRLVEMRADVDHQYTVSSICSAFGLVVAAKSLQYRLGRRTILSSLCYHISGMTPLMAALSTAQHEGAAALIASGARLDLRNSRNWSARDFARGQALPHFLLTGLEGDPVECQTVASLALSEGYVEI
mmetsp:Transcript_19932/g.46702  ORF Transcript_19932/g.46702 Transcript_19932/m.46702 type:complete len:622 (+) Transcript_19932:25-1890(+)|eukprot:s3583_g2.t1